MSAIVCTPSTISNQVACFLIESFLSDREQALAVDEELMTVLDSLQLLRMVIHIEEAFGITVDHSELTLENLGTLRQIEVFVNSKLG